MPDDVATVAGLDRGNPTQAADAGTKEPVTFATSLKDETGSGSQAASQQAAQDDKSQAKESTTTQTGVLPGYAAGLSKELKADPKIVAYAGKFKSMDDLVKAAMEADSKIGGMVSIPKDDAPETEWRAFYAKLGVPEKPEDYKLNAEGLGLSETQVDEIRKMAFGLNLTQKKAQELLRNASKSYTDLAKAYTERMRAVAKETEAAMKQEWGDKYSQNYNLMVRAMRAAGDSDLMKELEDSGMGNSRAFARFLAKVGSMISEDTTPHGGPHRMPARLGGIDRPGLED